MQFDDTYLSIRIGIRIYFVYASISSGKKLADMENNLESSITYKKTIQFLRDNFLDFELEKNVSRDSFNDCRIVLHLNQVQKRVCMPFHTHHQLGGRSCSRWYCIH